MRSEPIQNLKPEFVNQWSLPRRRVTGSYKVDTSIRRRVAYRVTALAQMAFASSYLESAASARRCQTQSSPFSTRSQHEKRCDKSQHDKASATFQNPVSCICIPSELSANDLSPGAQFVTSLAQRVMYLLRYASCHTSYRPHQAIGMEYLTPTCSTLHVVDMTSSECCHFYDEPSALGVTYATDIASGAQMGGTDET